VAKTSDGKFHRLQESLRLHTSTINVGNPTTVRIPEGIVTTIQNLYKNSKSNVNINGMSGEWFEVVTGCALSPFLFAIVLDWALEKVLENYNRGLE